MKRFLTFALIVFVVLYSLPGCGSGGEKIDYDLVFVNQSDAVIVEVVASFVDQFSGSRRADSCPLKRGGTLGFEAGEYPVTVAAYDKIYEGQEELASVTISSAPQPGERWYVIARDGENGLVLTVDTRLP